MLQSILLNLIIIFKIIIIKRNMRQEQSQQFKVAPIISNQKEEIFIKEIILTILGLPKEMLESLIISLINFITLYSVLIIIPLITTDIRIALIVPTAANVLLAIIFDVMRKGTSSIEMKHLVIKSIIFGMYNVLWANHLFVIQQLHSSEKGLIVVSCVAIATSICTISVGSVKEFGGYSVDNNLLGWDSTAFMRFFIAFPTLLVEIIYYNINGIDQSKQYLSFIRFISSFIFISWTFGWLSTFKNTSTFLSNKINMFILGQESQTGIHRILFSIVFNMAGIAVFQGIFYNFKVYSFTPIIVGATLSSIIIFIKNMCTYRSTKNRSYLRIIVMIVMECLICLMLCLIYTMTSLQSIKPQIFLGIDIGLYILFAIIKQLCHGWSRFGLNINLGCLKYSYILVLERFFLRIFSGLSILFILSHFVNNIVIYFGRSYETEVITYIIVPFLAFRSFKRSISLTNSFSLHFGILICLLSILNGSIVEGCLALLAMPPFPHNPYLTIISIFNIPPKAKHKNQVCYQVLYTFLTSFGFFLHLITLGIFQLTMIFGLPVYFPVISNETQGYEVKSAQNSLYQKMIQNIDESKFRFYQTGFYLLRVQKYIILMEIKQNNYGFCQIIDYKGLQVQEVTSCHSKQGQTIDKLVEQTWEVNKKCFSLSPYEIAITPFLKESINATIQNDIQLTGVIQSKEFVTLFKDAALKAIVRQYSKITLTEVQKRQGEVINSEISAFYKKEIAQKIFPFEFAKLNNISASYSQQIGKVKLPPLAKKSNKKQVHNDFLDLLQGSQQQFQQTGNTLNDKEPSILAQSRKQQKSQELNMSIILTLYYYSIGKLDYINSEKLYKIIKKQADIISQIEFDNYGKLLSCALACAFKISIDKYVSGQFEIGNQDFEEYQLTSFLGTSDSEEFAIAIREDKEHIWTINYLKKSLAIKRMAKVQTNMYIFKVSEVILKSVWNNLRFELVYATNDNDQRYSIQTHPTLLRNLWIEACQQPFGYPGFHSGATLNK